MRVFVAGSADVLTDHRGHGEGLIAWGILSRLAMRGHELTVCAPRVELSADAPFEIVTALPKAPLESVRPLEYAWRVRRAAAERPEGFDVAYWLFPQGSDELMSLIPSRIPLVIGPLAAKWHVARQGVRPGDVLRWGLAPLQRSLYLRTLRNAAAAMLATPTAAADLPNSVSGGKVVPFGIPTEAFQRAPLPRSRRAVYIGRFAPEKAVTRLVEAFATVQDRVPSASLVLAGDGPERGAIEQSILDHSLGDAVEVVGRVSHECVRELIASARVLCAPASGEPFGMTILEAMASGRGVLAIDRAGPSYLLKHAPEQLVPDNNPESLADGLVRLLSDDSLLESVAAKNWERVQQEFAVDRVIDQIEGLLRAAAEGRAQ